MNTPAISTSALSQFFEVSSSPFSFVFLCIFGALCAVLLLGVFSKKVEKLLKRVHVLEEKESPRSFLIWILSIIIVIRVVQVFIIQPFLVDGASMYPTFKSNNLLIVDKTYKYRGIARDDVIVFKFLKEGSNYSGRYFIKRIIGLPGDSLIIDGISTKIIDRNGEPVKVDESFVKNPKLSQYLEVKLKEDEYFVMGDNRDGSYDSRAWGPIHISQISGQPVLQLYPSLDILPGSVR